MWGGHLMFGLFSKNKDKEFLKKFLDEKESFIKKEIEYEKKLSEEKDKERLYLEKISELSLINKALSDENSELAIKILTLSEENKKYLSEKDIEQRFEKIHQKQIEIMEKNLRDKIREIDILKENINLLKENTIDANLPLVKHKYKISIEKFYSATKYSTFINLLHEKEVFFMNELSEELLYSLETQLKGIKEIKKNYNDFINGVLDIDTKLYLLKGEKISKLFSKNRKFVSYIAERSYEFMDDLIEYDFNELLEIGIKKEQINEIVLKSKKYFEENLIK